MKTLLLTIIFSALILPAMATDENLQEILADKKLAAQIKNSLQKTQEQQNKNIFVPDWQKADKALNTLIKENSDLKPLLEKVQTSHKNLISFLVRTENVDEASLLQTYKDLFYLLDSLTLDILEISKIDKDLADTIEKIVNHQYFFKALNIDVNASGLILATIKHYKPSFYENTALAQTPLKDQSSRTGYNREWQNFIDTWLKKHTK